MTVQSLVQKAALAMISTAFLYPASCAAVEATLIRSTTVPKPDSNKQVWTLDRFEDFRDGQFSDNRANTYVSASGRVQQVHRFDINNDGEIDVVFINTHPQGEKLDAMIYWGNSKDFSDNRCTPVPNAGAQWATAADLDNDGDMDIVLPSLMNGTWTKEPSGVYYNDVEELGQRTEDSPEWGTYPFASKVELPTESAQQSAVADLNRDGYPDVVFALSAGFWEYRDPNAAGLPSLIFWGSENAHQPDNYTEISTKKPADVAIADLNNDGWPDVVFANREWEGEVEIDSYIYFGGEDGFSPERRVDLPTKQANAVSLHDVNGDGFVDVMLANGVGNVSYVYLNDHGKFDKSRRIELPSSDARDILADDLNADGHTDVFISNFQTAENPRTTSSIYWGGADGFSPDRRQDLETVGAFGATLADLNADQLPEIVVSNQRDFVSFDVPSYIFWNSKDGFSDSRRTSLFTHGAIGNAVADFNGDGHQDVLFCNTMKRQRGGILPSFVYWGNKDGQFSADDRLELPSLEPYSWASADLNDDGWPDLVIANVAEIGRRVTENFVFWGSKDGISADRRTALLGHGSRGVNVADLDRDGFLDLVFLNAERSVFIYWGGADGFITPERTELPCGGLGFPIIADVTNDGHLDLVLSGNIDSPYLIYHGDGTRNYSEDRCTELPDSNYPTNSNVEVADINRDGFLDIIVSRRGHPAPKSHIYYGNQEGTFSADRRSEFRPYNTQGVTVDDLNEDGWLDIITPRYKNAGSRATMSRVYFGGPDGLDENNIMELPTNAGTGSQGYDFNHDGYKDLLLFCHRSEGDNNKPGTVSDHCTDSYLYWGGPDGFHEDRKLLIPGRGVHYDSGVDLGDIADRSYGFKYVSPPYEYGNQRGERIDWTAQTPHGSAVKFQIRTASSQSALQDVPWGGAAGPGSYYEKSGAGLTTPPGHSWIQLRTDFVQPDGIEPVILESVSVSFQ